nr:RluA family pseudouridine synthase [Evansella caseinilytica]
MNRLKLIWKVADKEAGQLLRTFLREEKRISKKALADIKFQGGQLTVNGEEVTVRYCIRAGDEVEVLFPAEEVSAGIVPVNRPLPIVFEDDYLLVINKPSALATIPSREHRESLAGAVIDYFQRNCIASTFHAVSRLDRDTSGLLMVAKYRYVHDLFVHASIGHPIARTYMALVHGKLTALSGTIDAPIARKSDSIIEREVSAEGQRAVTHFEVLEHYREATLVKVRLETGRTHQIRVHFSHIGHPLIGDTLYGGRKEGLNRHGLHSSEMVFTHPLTGKRHQLTCPLPRDMQEKISWMKNDPEDR